MRTPEEIVCAVLSDPENWSINELEMNMLDAEDSFWDSAPLKFIEIVGPSTKEGEK
jgi:hypothetical protein